MVSGQGSVGVSRQESVTGMGSATLTAVSAIWPVPWAAVVPGSAVKSCSRLTFLTLRVPFISGGCFVALLHRTVIFPFLLQL